MSKQFAISGKERRLKKKELSELKMFLMELEKRLGI